MEASTRKIRIIVGGKGVALSPLDVYNVAYKHALVELDAPALERLGRNCSKDGCLVTEPSITIGGERLDEPQGRAIVLVLLNKLLQLQGNCTIRKFLPVLLTEFLNSGLPTRICVLEDADERQVANAVVGRIYDLQKEMDQASEDVDGLSGVESLRRLKQKLIEANAGDFGFTAGDLRAVMRTEAAAVGISALSIHTASPLSAFADAVAALSCEALEANTRAFDAEAYNNQTCVHKFEADVASDLRSLLVGSKLTNAKKGETEAFISSIPLVNGSLREAVKVSAARLRVEINRGSAEDPQFFSLSLYDSIISLTLAFRRLVSSSLQRSDHGLDMIKSLNKDFAGEADESVLSLYRGLGQNPENTFTDATFAIRRDYGVRVARAFYGAFHCVCSVLAWEAAVTLRLLSLRDAAAKLRDKKRKGAQELGLGKGTAKLRQSLLRLLDVQPPDGLPGLANAPALQLWLRKLESWFAGDEALQAFVGEIKTIVESNEVGRLPKIAKGTRDFDPKQMAVREKAFSIISGVFKRHGAVSLDTPVFELRETLMGKYGEDSKLIYDLADQGGEILSLRYDLTVPFARYLAMNKVDKMKRYHIARVYRRDNPAKGRYREFYQCDFDIAGGGYQSMVPDFEVLKVLTELLDELNIGEYQVKLNHRWLLDGMLDLCGVPATKFRSICSAIDKLDKVEWKDVKKEMVDEKGLAEETADKIGVLVHKKGDPMEVLHELQERSPFAAHKGSTSALQELAILFRYLQSARCLHRIVFDLSLARGLDYYTGVIYEAVFKGSTSTSSQLGKDKKGIQVGSIAAGGRYDNLVGMFSKQPVPAVGVSLGIERVFAIMEQQQENGTRQGIRETQTEVVVVGLGDTLLDVVISLAAELWGSNLKAEFSCVSSGNIGKQIAKSGEIGIPWMVIIGPDDLENRVVILRDLATKVQVKVARESVAEELQKRLRLRETFERLGEDAEKTLRDQQKDIERPTVVQ